MPAPSPGLPARAEGVANGTPGTLLDSRRCGHCGRTIPKPRPGQKACWSRCRWALWRTRRTQAQARRDREIRELLEAALRALDQGVLR
jgi:predicted nucleic acid-binding Zn ribbon protein